MFGMKAKDLARRAKDSEPKVDDVKVNVDDMAPVGTEEPKAKAPKKQTFAEAFRAARARPTGSGSTFMWNGKKYNFSTKEEEAMRPGGRGPLTRNGGSFPESKKNTPGGRGPLSRSSTGPASKGKAKEDTTPKPVAAGAAAAAAGGYRTRGGGTQPSGMGGLGVSFRTADSIRADRAAETARNAASDKARADRQNAADSAFGARVKEDLEKNKYRTTFAKGGSVGYSKMEKEHVNQMKKHGVPEKYVKEEEKEAKGMKRGGRIGGMQGKAHRTGEKGDGVARKGKTGAELIKMASGGSVSRRVDGIASKGKTNCKYR